MEETAFQNTVGIDKPLWEWMSERVPSDHLVSDGPGCPGVSDLSNYPSLAFDHDGRVERPELQNFALAMMGGGKASGAAHAHGEKLRNNENTAVMTLMNRIRLPVGGSR